MITDLVRRIIRSPKATEAKPPAPHPSKSVTLGSRSVHLRHLDVGSCNGCEIELSACFSPVYDLEQYGISITASPRHADGALITGVVTRNMAQPLLNTVAAIPGPKRLIAIGDCAINGGPFLASYAVEGVPGDFVPIDLAVKGCPPEPAAIIAALRQLGRQ